MGPWLLSHFSADSLSWSGFIVLIAAMLGEVAVWLVPEHGASHKHLAFGFAALAVAGYSVERVGDDAIVSALEARAAAAETSLRKITSDRVLSDDQLASIADRIKSFAGQEYQVTTFWEMREPLAFANRVHEALQLAHWKYVPPASATMLLGGMEGVQVWVHPAADPQVRAAATELVNALNDVAPNAAVLREQNPKNPTDNKIGINVGTKP
jgi:hypothetical protein